MLMTPITATTLKSQPANRTVTINVLMPESGKEADQQYGVAVTAKIAINGNGFVVWWQAWIRVKASQGYEPGSEKPKLSNTDIQKLAEDTVPTIGRIRTTPTQKVGKAVRDGSLTVDQLKAVIAEIEAEAKADKEKAA